MLSHREVVEILISWVTLSLAFSWNVVLFAQQNPAYAAVLFPLFFVAIGTAFVLHELAHKYAALKLGYPAEYRMWPSGLLLALSLAILTGGRWVFAAPGAVYVYGFPNRRDDAYISLAGPLTNLFIAYFFLLVALTFGGPYFYYSPAMFVVRVNAFIGFFNMMPVFPLDGSKVIAYSPTLWLLTLLAFLPLLLVA